MNNPNPPPRLTAPSNLFTELPNEYKPLKDRLRSLMERFGQLSSIISDDEIELLIRTLIKSGTPEEKQEVEKAMGMFEHLCETREMLSREDEGERDEVEKRVKEVEGMYARLNGIREAFHRNE